MFACQHSGVEPDILVLSKALAHGFPAGAAVARAEIMDWEPGAHEGTLNGGPVIMEAAKAVLEVIERDHIIERAREQGHYLRKQLEALKERYPLIGDVRGLGLMVGVELVKDTRKTPAKDSRDRLLAEAFRRGLLLLGAGECSIRLAPPLIVTREQIDMGLSIIEDCLKIAG
jgi:4-aminobutyrate aminotransferase